MTAQVLEVVPSVNDWFNSHQISINSLKHLWPMQGKRDCP